MKTTLQITTAALFAATLLSSSNLSAQVDPIITLSEDHMIYFQGLPQASLSTYLDNSDNQNITRDGDMLYLDNSNPVDLSDLRDNTDNQYLLKFGHTLLLEDGGSVDFSEYAQNAHRDGDMLLIDNADPVDLSDLRDNTDNQYLLKFGHTLLLEDGGSVDFSSYMDNTDEQTISATTSANNLRLSISNGNDIDIDMAPVFEEHKLAIKALLLQVEALTERVTALEACSCQTIKTTGQSKPQTIEANGGLNARGTQTQTQDVDAKVTTENSAKLYQNIPNPFQATSSIKLFVPEQAKSAVVKFSNTSGKTVSSIDLNQRGYSELDVNASDLSAGIYLYTLYVDGKLISTRKMVVK